MFMETRIRTLATISAAHFSAHLDEVRLNSGLHKTRIRMDHPLAAAVIPLLDDNHVVMVKQFRYAIGRETLEIPAGKVDPGEASLACAHRELLEETGYEAGSMERMYSFFPAIGYSNEVIDIYVARRLKKIREQVDETEISRVEVLPWETVRRMASEEVIQDSKTVLAIGLMAGCLKPDRNR